MFESGIVEVPASISEAPDPHLFLALHKVDFGTFKHYARGYVLHQKARSHPKRWPNSATSGSYSF